ncbi:hypothetical protein QWZ13_07580 [Reinekea marina]|nr:hypothetical protein [Reinekea marina]MDN3648770.1 hypothetical protein [Reinekea marina]
MSRAFFIIIPLILRELFGDQFTHDEQLKKPHNSGFYKVSVKFTLKN